MERETKRICDLKAGEKGFNITVEIKEKEEAREITIKSTGQKQKVSNAKVKDDTGDIKMTLWGKDAEEINKGDFIRLENGLVVDYKEVLELTPGKYGKIIRLNE